MHFKIKKSLPLQRIFDAFAEKQGKNVKDLRFTLDGNRVKGNMTAEQMGLEDGETIEVFLEQLGGFGWVYCNIIS